MTASPAFLSRLCDADLAALAKRWDERGYRNNELIIAHGDGGRDVFFLLEGRARVTLFSEDGREIAYRDIEPGEIFGELAGIDGKQRSASVVALGAVMRAIIAKARTFRNSAAYRRVQENHEQKAWNLKGDFDPYDFVDRYRHLVEDARRPRWKALSSCGH